MSKIDKLIAEALSFRGGSKNSNYLEVRMARELKRAQDRIYELEQTLDMESLGSVD